MSESAALLSVTALCAWYGQAQALFDVNVEVRKGEVVALMGRNGAGKATTFKALMGLMPRRSGQVHWMGQSVANAQAYEIARLGMAYVPENRRLFTDLTVLENLDVARQAPRHWPDGSAAPVWTVDSLFALFPNLAAMPHRRAGHMSGGEQKMLSVARSLMGNPYLVLLDEPSEGVAPVIVEQMAAMILRLKAQGLSVLLSEQNLHFAHQVADRAVVLEKGAVLYSGPLAGLPSEQ